MRVKKTSQRQWATVFHVFSTIQGKEGQAFSATFALRLSTMPGLASTWLIQSLGSRSAPNLSPKQGKWDFHVKCQTLSAEDSN